MEKNGQANHNHALLKTEFISDAAFTSHFWSRNYELIAFKFLHERAFMCDFSPRKLGEHVKAALILEAFCSHHLRWCRSYQTLGLWSPQRSLPVSRSRWWRGWPNVKEGFIRLVSFILFSLPSSAVLQILSFLPLWYSGARVCLCSRCRQHRKVWSTSAVCAPSSLSLRDWGRPRTPWSLYNRPAREINISNTVESTPHSKKP